MKRIILLILIFVSILFFICLKKDIVQALPEAELGKPYFYSIDISDGQRTYSDHFVATVTPKNSGLNVSLGGEMGERSCCFRNSKGSARYSN